jgi:TP901 family phage tail tape measure protein
VTEISDAVDIGGIRAKVELDLTEYSAGINKAKVGMKELGDQGRKTAADFGQFSSVKDKIAPLAASLDNVNAKIEDQKRKLATLKESYNSAFNDARKSKLQEQINNTEAALLRLTQTSDNIAKKIWDLEDSAGKAAVSFSDLSGKLKELGLRSSDIDALERSLKKTNPEILRQQIAEVTAELKELGASSSEIDKVTKELEKNAHGASNASKELKALGVAYAGIAAAMGAVITKSVQTAAEFEQSMANVKAISQATGDEFERLRNQALQLGATTKFTAAQTADAQALLAQAGFKTNEIIASLPGVLSLAAAGQTDLATTADIASSALNGFRLNAEETARVADVLAKSSIDTNADVTDLGMALKYIAPVAASMGVSIEEAVAAIGELSNAGIKGEMAGTQLRAMLLALASPSDEAAGYMEKLGVSIADSAGNIKPLGVVIGELEGAFSRLTQVQQADVAATLVGREAASGFLTLISQGKTTLDNYTASLQDAGGTAAEVAGVQMDTLKGATLELQAAFEASGIAIGDKLAPAIRQVAEFITKLLQGFTEMNPALQSAIVAFGVATASVLGLAAAFGVLAIALGGLKIAAAPFLAVAIAIGAVTAGIVALVSHSKQAAEATREHEAAQTKLNEALDKSPLSNTVQDVQNMRDSLNELNPLLEERAKLQERLNEIEAAGNRGEGTPALLTEAMDINEQLEEMDKKLRTMGYDGVEDATEKAESLNEQINESIPALREMERAEINALATKVQHIDKVEKLRDEYDKLTAEEKLSEQQKAQLAGVVEALTKEYPGLIAQLDEENQWHITNRGSLDDLISAESESVSASAKASKSRLHNWKVETEAKLKLARAQISALEKIENFNFAGSKIGQRLPGEVGKGFEMIGDRILGAVRAKAQQNANAYQLDLNEIEKDIASITSGTYGKFDTGGGIDLSDPKKEKKKKAKKEKKKKKEKSAAELAAEARKKAYDADVATIRYQADMYDWSADKQIEAYEKLRTAHKRHLADTVEDRRTLDLQLKRLAEDSAKSRYDFSAEWIAKEERRMEDSAKSEVSIAQTKINAWTRVRDRYKKDSEEYKKADEEIYKARKNLAKAEEDEAKRQYGASSDWITAQERRMQDTGKSEQEIAKMKLDAWTRVRDRYTKDSELYKKADEEVYKARKSYTEKSTKLIEESVKKEKSAIETAKKAELDAIEERKKAFVDAQDAKIKAIEDLIAAEAQLNVDADYETQLAEKRARVDELASAVGPEGIQEREDTLKEIERMQLEHERDLRKRELEEQKKALQDEKDTQSKAFDDEKSAAESQFNALIEAFNSYGGDIKMIEAAISTFRVSENASANAAILSELDSFVSQYNAKMAQISKVTATPDSDLSEYNANKDAWASAKARGDSAEMARLAARNEELRKKYGIAADTGKLQSFAVGGVVEGRSGEAVIAQVHAGEMVLNAQQQSALWGALSGRTMAPAANAAPAVTTITNHFDMGADEVVLADKADIATFYDERARTVQRLQTQGVKTR